ncbi:FAS1-like dehydratase domain-containing protein [Streptomyces sp. NPDC002577]
MVAGQITDEGVAALRARIGIPHPNPVPPHYRRPGEDAFRNVARCYGDDNPLWSEPDYAAKSRWGGLIAPPPLVGGDSLIGTDVLSGAEREAAKALKGDPLRGVHAFYAAAERDWWAPLTPGHTLSRRNALVAVHDKPSQFGGRAVYEWEAQLFRTDDGVLVGGQYRCMVRTEREKARKRKKESVQAQTWSSGEIAEIDAAGEAHTRRGAEPRWFEDLSVGDSTGTMIKGPMTVTDMICWHVGMGMGIYGVAALDLARANRRRIPRFYEPDALGIPDVMQRVHWDPAYAHKAGLPTTYDYGRMRETWLIHLLTDWMGDDAWLRWLRVEFRKFNYVGDAQYLSGTVTRLHRDEGGRPAADLDLTAVNQRGETTTTGKATVLLPSREHGPVRLPDQPGTSLEEAMDAAVTVFSGRD